MASASYSITDPFGRMHRLENSEDYYPDLDKKMIKSGKKLARQHGWKTFKIGREFPAARLIYIFDERTFL